MVSPKDVGPLYLPGLEPGACLEAQPIVRHLLHATDIRYIRQTLMPARQTCQQVQVETACLSGLHRHLLPIQIRHQALLGTFYVGSHREKFREFPFFNKEICCTVSYLGGVKDSLSVFEAILLRKVLYF